MSIRATALVACVGLWLACGNTASAATLCVAPGGGGGCATSIQAAIDAAQPGDVIAVHAGEYAENVTIDKPLTLAGANEERPVVRPAISNPNPCPGSSLCGGTASNIILVQASNVTIHDLVLDGDNPSLTSGIVRGGADLDARNGIITNHLAGVFQNLTVFSVTVRNVYLRGLYASTGGTFAFVGNRIDNVQGDYYSIGMFNFGGSGTMARNHVSRANDAISSNWSSGVRMIDNLVTESASGLHTDNSSGNDTIARNRVAHGDPLTTGSSTYGVWTFVAYAPITVRDNTVEDVDVGLATFGAADPVAPAQTSFVNNVVSGRRAPGSIGVWVTTDQLGFGSSGVAAAFTHNVVTGFSDGFLLQSDPGNGIHVRATCNDIRHTARSAAAGGAYQADAAGVQDVSFESNNMTASAIGFANLAAGTIDAQKNWWGCRAGPGAPRCGTVSGDVDVRFWLQAPSRCAAHGGDNR